jgi:hypothetical protein
MSNQSIGGIYIVNPATGEAEAITSEDLAAREARASEPAPIKTSTRKRPEEMTNGSEN